MLKPPTLTKGYADEVAFVETRDLLDSPPFIPNARRKPKRWSPDDPVSLFDGNEGLLVRTVLLRSGHFDPTADLPQIASSEDVHRLVKHVGFHDQEHIVILALNSQNKVTAIYEAAIGATGHASLEARTVIKIVLLSGASGCILVHNHPGGSTFPSREDKHLTKQVAAALGCLGYVLVDHIIVSYEKHYSFREAGLESLLEG